MKRLFAVLYLMLALVRIIKLKKINRMDEKRIALKWYLKGARDADKTSEIPHIEMDFKTHFELQYRNDLECKNVINAIDNIINGND